MKCQNPQKTTEDILRDLVAMPTVSGDHDAIRQALDYIETFLKSFGLCIKRHRWNGVESLVATTKKTKTPTAFLAAHVDVVPAAKGQFHLRKMDGKYLGRGVRDMKGALAAFLSVIAELGDELKDYNLGLMVTTDEEVGGFDGAAKLVEAGYIPKVLILPDGGSDWNIERIAKGLWHFTLEARGKTAHASRPWEGENAIDKILEAIHGVRSLFPAYQTPETNTVNIGKIQGGEAINQIAANVSVGIDARFISASERMRIMAAIRQIAKAQELQLTSVVESDPIVNDPRNPYLVLYAECTKEVTGKTPEWVVSNAASDARYFVDRGTVCIVSYPPGGDHHGPDEWITEESLGQMHKLFLAYVQQVAKIPSKSKITNAR